VILTRRFLISVAGPFATSVSSVAAAFVISVAAIVAQSPATVWDGVYTDEQARRGNGLYQANCAACHGDSLQGGEAAPPLAGDTFNSTWDGVKLGDLFDRIRSTMPQNQPGSLSRAQNSDVLAFMLASGKFPAGDKAFDAQTMGETMFRSYRP
jgi:mono/diheme cytochrome c family protein